jgi:hypothetical protein
MKAQPGHEFGRAIAGLAALLMSCLIAGAQSGVIPAEPDAFFAPMPVITAIWVGLLLGTLLVWLPERSPPVLRAAVAFVVLCLVAVVCNWSAFAPGVTYTRTTSFGGFETTHVDPIGGRFVFGVAAIVVDLILLGGIAYAVRRIVVRPGR